MDGKGNSMKAVLCFFAFAVSLFAADDPLVGVLKHGDVYEFSVIFQQPVDFLSIQDLDHYAATSAQFSASRLTATNQGVILTATGPTPGLDGVMQISHVLDASQNEIPPASIGFTVTNRFWTVIGGNELGFTPEVTAISTNGFDVFSGGIEQRDYYDEATFVGEVVTNDFNRIVRVQSVDPAGLGAKAGLMVRESLDEGKGRPLNPDDPAQAFSRYIELAVSSPQTADGQAGDTTHRIWMRPTNGNLVTQSLTVTNDAAPKFPDAWLRIQRVGNEFKMFRGTNGVAWEQIGSAQFTDPAPTNLYVGVAFSPQNDDLSFNSGLRDLFVAKFRDYSGSSTTRPSLTLKRINGQGELSWTNATSATWVLETTTTIPNPTWDVAASQQNPQTIDLADQKRFFRLRSTGN